MKITIAQLNPVVGDIDGNYTKLASVLEKTRTETPDLIVFPELFLTGYPPRDLLERPWFIVKAQSVLKKIVELSSKYPTTGILCGVVVPTE